MTVPTRSVKSVVRVVLLRVGIDMGCGRQHSPVFQDDTFRFLPIPEERYEFEEWEDAATYKSECLERYVPDRLRTSPIHNDPEFSGLTYGDLPSSAKKVLTGLSKGDYIAFYAGFQDWHNGRFKASPSVLRLFGYFRLAEDPVRANSMRWESAKERFGTNIHVRHREMYEDADDNSRLVLFRGSQQGSRLLSRALTISEREPGTGLLRMSKEARQHFGSFTTRNIIQRSVPRVVPSAQTSAAIDFLTSLPNE